MGSLQRMEAYGIVPGSIKSIHRLDVSGVHVVPADGRITPYAFVICKAGIVDPTGELVLGIGVRPL